jgi:hypothetical protein
MVFFPNLVPPEAEDAVDAGSGWASKPAGCAANRPPPVVTVYRLPRLPEMSDFVQGGFPDPGQWEDGGTTGSWGGQTTGLAPFWKRGRWFG